LDIFIISLISKLELQV